MKVNPDDEGEGTELTDMSSNADNVNTAAAEGGDAAEGIPEAVTTGENLAADAAEIGEVGIEAGAEAGLDAGLEGAGAAIDAASAGLEVASGGLATGIALAGGFVGTGLMVLGSLAGVGGAVSSVASIVADSGMTKADDWIEKNVFHHTLNAPKLPEPSSIGQIAQSAVLPVFDRSAD